ncbi:MAG: hypothetical protein ACRDHK_14195, partial [Actinomycetota bacterium]
MTTTLRALAGAALTFAVVVTVVLVADGPLGVKTVTSARAQVGRATPPPSSASCQACHAGIEPMHETVELTCTECHGGDGSQREKANAHVLPRNRDLWKTSANPSSTYGAVNLESPEFIRFVN